MLKIKQFKYCPAQSLETPKGSRIYITPQIYALTDDGRLWLSTFSLEGKSGPWQLIIQPGTDPE